MIELFIQTSCTKKQQSISADQMDQPVSVTRPGSATLRSEEEGRKGNNIGVNSIIAMDKKRKKKVVKRLDKARSTAPQLHGLSPFYGPLKNVKMTKERCQKIRRFLDQQSRNTGRSIGDILSQSISHREVSFQNIHSSYLYKIAEKQCYIRFNNSLQAAQLNQHLFEQTSPDPDKPSGLISPPPGAQPVVKDEPDDESNEVCLRI